MEPVLLRVEEAAYLLGIGRTRVYDLIRSDQLESVMVFGARRIPRTAIDDYVRWLRKGAA